MSWTVLRILIITICALRRAWLMRFCSDHPDCYLLLFIIIIVINIIVVVIITITLIVMTTAFLSPARLTA